MLFFMLLESFYIGFCWMVENLFFFLFLLKQVIKIVELFFMPSLVFFFSLKYLYVEFLHSSFFGIFSVYVSLFFSGANARKIQDYGCVNVIVCEIDWKRFFLDLFRVKNISRMYVYTHFFHHFFFAGKWFSLKYRWGMK